MLSTIKISEPLHSQPVLAAAIPLSTRKEQARPLTSRMDALLDALPSGVLILDAKGIVSDCNPAAEEMLGEPLRGMRWIDIIERSFCPRSDDGHEISTIDGRRLKVETRSVAGEKGQLLVLTDQTETRALQEKLARQQRLGAMGQMASALAHQIRTPLSAAMLYAGHLADGQLNPQKSIQFAGKLQDRLLQLEQQVKDMLVYARGDVSLTDTLSAAEWLQLLQQSNDRAAERVHWSFSNAEMATLTLRCNAQVLIGAILNLLNNAVEANASQVRVQVSSSCSGNNCLLAIKVIDDGDGMDEATLSKVQQAFVTTKSQGTGLGLAVAEMVVKGHGGRLQLSSEVGQGTCVNLYLPVVRAQ